MARIRSIKPSIWGDDKFSDLSRDARLLLVGIISNADDRGRFIATPSSIAGTVFPHDDLNLRDIKKWRDEIAATGIVELYEIKGRCYGWLPRWKRHQRIDKPQPSHLPPPPGWNDEPPLPEPPNDSENESPNPSENQSPNGYRNHSTPEEDKEGSSCSGSVDPLPLDAVPREAESGREDQQPNPCTHNPAKRREACMACAREAKAS